MVSEIIAIAALEFTPWANQKFKVPISHSSSKERKILIL
jgi:hypothetical protein